MPTAQEFEDLANIVDDQAQRLSEQIPLLSNQKIDTPLQGGRLEVAVDDSFDSIIDGIGALRDTATGLANELRARAQQCRDYSEAMLTYGQRVYNWEISERPLPKEKRSPYPTAPAREHEWIEAG